MQINKKGEHGKALLGGLIFCVCLFLASGAAFAQDPGEEAAARTGVKTEVTIKEKMRTSLLTSQRLFRITEDTRIMDTKGRAIRLERLAVPCKAEIEYQPDSVGDPEALEIKVLKLLPGATTLFPRPVPE